MTRGTRSNRGAVLWWVLLLVAAAAVTAVILLRGEAQSTVSDRSLLETVRREKLRISVLESGQLKAAKSVDIYSEVRGVTTILKLIDEGTEVEEGEILVELDASGVEDELTQQKIRYEQAKAAWIQAKEAKAIQESINESNRARARLDLDLARTDLKKFQEGDWPLRQEEADENIKLYEVERKTAEQTLEDTRELVDLNFAALTELERDQLEWERARVKLQLKRREKQIMEQFEYDREIQVLESKIIEFEAEQERVIRQASADLAQKEADLKSKEATFQLEETKLERLNEQMENAVVRAPTAGLVVYPGNSGGFRGGGQDRIEEGASVRERQLLISLPDTSSMVSLLDVHESAIDKVQMGQPAVVTIDALPDQVFYGKVSFVAPLPDTANQWLNPDLKVYKVEVTLSGDTTLLRPGMSVANEIVVDELADALSIPVHAVHRKGARLFCYVERGDGPEVQPVEVGLANESRVAILNGLNEGDRVYLSPPPDAPAPDFPEDDTRGNQRPSLEELQKKTEGVDVMASSREGDQKKGEEERGGGKDERAAAMEKWNKASPEDREKMMKEFQKKYENMTPEQRQEAMKKWGRGQQGSKP